MVIKIFYTSKNILHEKIVGHNAADKFGGSKNTSESA